MFHHIALAINDPLEKENFYKNILDFKDEYQFTINKETTSQIFSCEATIDVHVMSYNNITLELFFSPEKEKKTFNHSCFLLKNAEEIYEKAKQYGYKTVKRETTEKINYFIWDKSGNMFELKTG